MNAHYNFAGGRRGPILNVPNGKTRVTIRLDTDLLDWFRHQVHNAGGGSYQTLINTALREHVATKAGAWERTLRQVLRQELARHAPPRAGRSASAATRRSILRS